MAWASGIGYNVYAGKSITEKVAAALQQAYMMGLTKGWALERHEEEE